MLSGLFVLRCVWLTPPSRQIQPAHGVLCVKGISAWITVLLEIGTLSMQSLPQDSVYISNTVAHCVCQNKVDFIGKNNSDKTKQSLAQQNCICDPHRCTMLSWCARFVSKWYSRLDRSCVTSGSFSCVKLWVHIGCVQISYILLKFIWIIVWCLSTFFFVNICNRDV